MDQPSKWMFTAIEVCEVLVMECCFGRDSCPRMVSQHELKQSCSTPIHNFHLTYATFSHYNSKMFARCTHHV